MSRSIKQEKEREKSSMTDRFVAIYYRLLEAVLFYDIRFSFFVGYACVTFIQK